MPFFVYILRNPNGRLYIGQASNLPGRLTMHKTKKAAKYVRDYGSFHLAYFEKYHTRSEAMRREKQLKGWKRVKKEALIASDLVALKKA